MNKLCSSQSPTSIKIIFVGNVIVNIPVVLIIIISVFFFMNLGVSFNFSLVFGATVSWFFWSKLINIWKKWAFSKGVSPERLYKLGRIGLINFFRHKIFD